MPLGSSEPKWRVSKPTIVSMTNDMVCTLVKAKENLPDR